MPLIPVVFGCRKCLCNTARDIKEMTKGVGLQHLTTGALFRFTDVGTTNNMINMSNDGIAIDSYSNMKCLEQSSAHILKQIRK